ncbi:MAG: ATP-grasp domain-containing protein [Clostridium sp.]|nr:ATP-grasp domain-containing protein [Clostridium sp.]
MNFVFISPQFPHTYWNFCDRLKRNGVNVLGIGDTPYDALDWNVKNSLTEYYWVDSLENYDQVFRAVAFFSFKYGKIDWLESNNEYWLEQDAKLRTEFHITSGIGSEDIQKYKSKADMKKYYAAAGVPTARQTVVSTKEAAEEFIKTVDFPVIVKPEIGVGANDTHKLSSQEDLDTFFAALPEVPYVMEEFVDGDLRSYDAIIDSKGEPVFESMTVWPVPVMDTVEEHKDLNYYTAAKLPAGLQKAGRATVKAFGVKSRFVHLEFFRLRKTKAGLGKKGDFAGLEVNMRPAGGYTPDMMNFAHSIDVYQIWADMVTADRRLFPESGDDQFCVYAGRRDIYSYVHTHGEIMEKYGSCMVMQEEMPEMMVPQMGNRMYTVKLKTEEEAEEFIRFVQEKED